MTTPAPPDWAVAIPNADIHSMPGTGPTAPATDFFTNRLKDLLPSFFRYMFAQVGLSFGGTDADGWDPLDWIADWAQGIAKVFNLSSSSELALTLDLQALWRNLMENSVPPDTIFAGSSAQGNNLINTIGAAFSGLIGAIFDLDGAQQRMADASAMIAANAAAIDALQQKAKQSNANGIFKLIDFSTLPNTTNLPADFTQTYLTGSSGSFGVSGGRAKITAAGTSGRATIGVYQPTQTLGDNQQIIGVWPAVPDKDIFGNRGANYLLARCNPSGSSRVYGALAQDRAELGCFVSGVKTVFATSTSFRFRANTPYYLLAGTAGGARSFEIRERYADGVLVLSHTEAGTTSQLGAGFRRGGLGAEWVATGLGHTAAGEQLYIGIADNLATSVVGSTFRAVRTSTSGVNASSGDNQLPANWYSVEIISPDYTWNPATNTLTVSVTDTYTVKVSQCVSAGLILTMNWQPILYRDIGLGGGVIRRGATASYIAGSSSTVCASDTFQVYCEAGDTLTPGYFCTTSPLGALTGESGGRETYFSVTRGRQIADG